MENLTQIKKLVSLQIDDDNCKAILTFEDQSIETIEYEQIVSNDWLFIENVGDIRIYDYYENRDNDESFICLDQSLLSEDGYGGIVYPYPDNLNDFYHIKLLREY